MNRGRNITLLMLHAFLSGCWFFIPVLYIFLKEKGFSFTEIGFIASCKIGSKFFLEIPAGLFSDRFGPKKSIIISSAAFGISFFMVGITESFFLMIVASFLNGVGQSFLSSSDSTMIYETLARQGKETEFSYFMGRKNSLNFLGFSLSAFGTTLIIPYGLQFTFYVSSLFLLLSMLVIFLLDDVKTHHVEFNSLKQLTGSINFIRQNASLRSILLYIVFFDIAIQIFFHYQQFLYKDIGVKDSELGYVYGLAVLFSLFASKYSYVLKGKFSTHKILVGLSIALGGAILAAGTSGVAIFTILAIVVFQLSLGFSKTLLIGIFQAANVGDKRATIFACKKSLYSLIFLICTPVYGLVADNYGVRVAVMALMVFVLVNLTLIYFFERINPSKIPSNI